MIIINPWKGMGQAEGGRDQRPSGQKSGTLTITLGQKHNTGLYKGYLCISVYDRNLFHLVTLDDICIAMAENTIWAMR